MLAGRRHVKSDLNQCSFFSSDENGYLQKVRGFIGVSKRMADGWIRTHEYSNPNAFCQALQRISSAPGLN